MVQGGEGPESEAMRAEHAALLEFASAARSAIAQLRPEELRGRDLPIAMGEIGMIVQTSEEAANAIMDAVEEILRLSGEADAQRCKAEIETNCHRILAACSFQDLTGQRMAKLVETLLVIEDKLGAVEMALDGAHAPAAAAPPARAETPTEPNADDSLLNGPAMPGEGLDQDEIDRLFADSV